MPSKKLFIGKQHVIIIRPKYIKYGIAHTQKKVKRIVAIPEWKFWMFYVFGDGMLMILFYRKHGSTSATQTWLKKSTTEKLQRIIIYKIFTNKRFNDPPSHHHRHRPHSPARLESHRLRCRPFCTGAQRPKLCIQNGHYLL